MTEHGPVEVVDSAILEIGDVGVVQVALGEAGDQIAVLGAGPLRRKGGGAVDRVCCPFVTVQFHWSSPRSSGAVDGGSIRTAEP